ncbi:MAG: DUF3857 domain-containing protein, partial [Candidatus Cloacimonetes bacterium]|nr:DUF3857 domain-containing protein [Candidatus Cloacimonadota bacterium]
LANREPDCALIKYHLLEAYARQEKYDEYSSAMEYLYSRKLTIPLVITYMINKFMYAEDFDKVYELIQDLEQLLPDSPEVYYAYIEYFGEKELYEKFYNMINKAYDKYPYDNDFVSIKAMLEINASNNYNEAINIYQKALEGNYSINNLTVLANCYLENSQLEKWEEIMLAARDLFPSSSSFCYSMAQVYYNYQLYDKAYQLADSALQISPVVGAYWNLLGKISQFLGETAKTIEAYQQAIKYDPTNYEARALIREFEGKKSIFNVFPVTSLEETIAAAPEASEYPNDNSLILLHDMKKVVYEFGGSEFQNEILIKILTRTGIEEHTEMKIPYNYYNQVLTIEEAIVIKSNGEKIKADIDQNTVVIKNIEVNDFIYLRWKLKDYFSGELLANFWDQVNFNFFYPAKKIRYSLLVPDDREFEYSCQNFELEPVLDKTTEGDLYIWELTDEPAVEHEYGMPDLDYCGKILHYSSIPDWRFIIDWFSDLAYNKTKITYEIEDLINDLLPDQEYSEEDKISLIYEFITENITYSSVPFRQSRFVPQKARDVLTTKIGDCKDMSCLMITMLKEAGISADFVLINTNNQGQLVKDLPSTNSFNHCIVAVHTESGVKFFDPTAKNYPVGSIPSSDKQAFYLIINDNTTSPAYLSPDQFMKNIITRESEVTVDELDSITISNVCSKSGEVGASMRYAYRHISEKERNKKLHEILSREHQNCNLISFNLIEPDALKQEFLYEYSYEVPNYLENVGNYKLMVLPWADKLTTESSIFMDERDYPFIWNGNVDVYQARINVNLPSGWMPLELPGTISYSCPNAEYNIKLVYEDGVISGERNLIFNSKHISPEEYPLFREFYHNVVKADQTKILLTSP